MSSFYSYLWALWDHWELIVFGGVLEAEQLLEQFFPSIKAWVDSRTQAEQRKRVVNYLALFAIFLAGFLAWKDEHIAHDATKTELAQCKTERDHLSLPDLKASMDAVFASKNLTPGVSETGIFVQANIRNTGERSFVTRYSLKIDSPALHVRLKPREIPPGIRVSTTASANMQTIYKIGPDTALDKKTIAPIERNSVVGGWLLFVYQGDIISLLDEPGTTLTLIFYDALDREIKTNIGKGHFSKDAWPSEYYCPVL